MDEPIDGTSFEKIWQETMQRFPWVEILVSSQNYRSKPGTDLAMLVIGHAPEYKEQRWLYDNTVGGPYSHHNLGPAMCWALQGNAVLFRHPPANVRGYIVAAYGALSIEEKDPMDELTQVIAQELGFGVISVSLNQVMSSSFPESENLIPEIFLAGPDPASTPIIVSSSNQNHQRYMPGTRMGRRDFTQTIASGFEVILYTMARGSLSTRGVAGR